MRRAFPLPVVSLLFILVTALAARAQAPSLQQLFAFACTSTSCPDGKEPDALILASDGNLYGVSEYSNTATGVAGGGTIFKMTPAGQITVLYTFPENQTTGFFPNGYAPDAIAEGSDGMLYGAASVGGTTSASAGTLWRISKTGTGFQVLERYCTSCTSGGFPNSIVAGTDGNLYGTTGYGGTFPSSGICESLGCGVVFKLTTSGAYTVLHAFNGTSETSEPLGVMQASDGNLYGATGGNLSEGSVFKLTPSGQFSTLHLFGSGTYALAGVTQASDGLLYGFSHVVSAPAVELFNITTGRVLPESCPDHAAVVQAVRACPADPGIGWQSLDRGCRGRFRQLGPRPGGHHQGRDRAESELHQQERELRNRQAGPARRRNPLWDHHQGRHHLHRIHCLGGDLHRHRASRPLKATADRWPCSESQDPLRQRS